MLLRLLPTKPPIFWNAPLAACWAATLCCTLPTPTSKRVEWSMTKYIKCTTNSSVSETLTQHWYVKHFNKHVRKYLKKTYSTISLLQTYVQYMKFARRAEGIKSARNVFKKAREDTRSRYHVFVAAALMEYYCSKDKDIAFRIFELGLKRFGGSPEYVMCYVDYLSHLNGMCWTWTNVVQCIGMVLSSSNLSVIHRGQ